MFKKREKGGKFVISVLITLFIVGLLIISGPVSAIVVEIIGLSGSSIVHGDSKTFNVSITMENPDTFVPISNVTLDINGPTSKQWTFDPFTGGLINPPEDANNLSITVISSPNSNHFGYGYGYGVDTVGYGYDFGYGYGYGYGYGNGGGSVQLIYSVTLNTSNLINGSYTAMAYLNTGNTNKPNFGSSSADFEVTATATPTPTPTATPTPTPTATPTPTPTATPTPTPTATPTPTPTATPTPTPTPTATPTPLVITITNPPNGNTTRNSYVNVTATLNVDGTARYLNWQDQNHTKTPTTQQPAGTVFYRNMTGLLSGNYSFKVYGNDTNGASNVSETRVVTVNRTIVDTTIGNFINTTTFLVNTTINITSPSGNVTVTIPNGTNASIGGAALTSISIDSLAALNSTFIAGLGSDKLIGENLSLGPEGALFNPDIQIRFNYTGAQLSAAGISASELRIKFYNVTSNTWVELTPYFLNSTGHYIIANVSHFSIFALIGVPAPTYNPPSNGGGGGSSGGGGGGGASGENRINIEVIEKYDLQISKDVTTSYRFKDPKNPIMFVNITGNTSFGVITTSIEVLKTTSTLVKTSPEGLIYKNANIWVGTSNYATPKNIKQALIKFKVDNAWMSINAISGSDIKLLRWNGKGWETLETKEINKDSSYTYFEAETKNFSPFSIVGMKSESGQVSNPPGVITPDAQAVVTNIPEKETPNNYNYLIAGLIGVFILIFIGVQRVAKDKLAKKEYKVKNNDSDEKNEVENTNSDMNPEDMIK